MHFEFLVEGQSDKIFLSIILSKILGEYGKPHTWKIHKHRGKGNLPENFEKSPNEKNKTLLHNLVARLKVYGKSDYPGQIIIVLIDNDDDDCKLLKQEIMRILDCCDPALKMFCCIAIEELEAWYLGDQQAIFSVYPHTKSAGQLIEYVQDSKCETAELLMINALPEAYKKIREKGTRTSRKGDLKEILAKKITPHMDVNRNISPSFIHFREKLRTLASA